jgi:hypothetical protein
MEEFHRTEADLEADVAQVAASPKAEGTVELIVRRPEVEEREVVVTAELDLVEGLVGDMWKRRGSSRSEDGSANPDAQVTVMNAHAAQAVAGSRDRWPLAGDQLYVNFDLSTENLPAGTRVAVGSAVVEVTAEPHTGCAKFRARFGSDALRWVNQPPGRELRLRGVNVRVVESGTVRTGDLVRRL